MRVVAAALAVLCATMVAATAADRNDAAFAVGVLRRDGVIIPFGVFDGRSWSSHWPEPADDLTIPIDVRSVPSRWWGSTGPVDTWQVWFQRGEPQTVRAVQPDWVGAHCVRQLGLRTDYRPAELPPPPDEQPYPKDGLAIAPPRQVAPIDIVSPSGADAESVSVELRAAFNRAETKVSSRFAHPMAPSVRESMKPTIEAMYGFGDEPRVFYVEAVRKYESAGEFECLSAFGTGWFVRENGRFRSLAMVVDLFDCNRQGASYMLPLGVVRTGTRLFWFVQFSGFDHERYAVIEPRAKGVDAALSVWGGGC